MSSRVFQSGYYAPMESWSLDIRRYIGERTGATEKTERGSGPGSRDSENVR
jgi:hypothetical protein